VDVGDGEVGAGFPYPQYMLCSRFFCPHLALPNLISPCPTSSRLTFPDPGLPWIPQGGLPGLVKKADSNLAVVEKFVAENDWIDFLATDPATRSNTSVCLSLKLSKDQIKKMTSLLEKERVAFDIGSYRYGILRSYPPTPFLPCGVHTLPVAKGPGLLFL
jgi:hypothetical protein